MRVRRCLVLLIAAFLLHAGSARAAPALFVARAGGLTVYLLGSFHALPPGTKWEVPAIDKAFDAAGQAWFEAVIDDMPKDLASTMMTLGLERGTKLSERLDPAEAAKLEAVVGTLPLPYSMPLIDGMRPWLAAVTIGVGEAQRAGFEEGLGVDHVLQARAKGQHKPMTAIEDPAATLRSIAELPDSAGLAMLREALGLKSPEKVLKAFFHAWLDGDLVRIGQLLGGSGALEGGFERTLLTQRNAAWAERLAGLKGSGATIFVTVGAGHLAGTGNLRDLLVQKGFSVRRVPTGGAGR